MRSLCLTKLKNDDLLFSVADAGFEKFSQAIGAAAANAQDPCQRLIDMAHAYVNFGLKNSEHYQLMFMQRTDFSLDQPEKDFEPRISSFQILQQAVEQAIAAGIFRADNPLAMSDAIWAQFHGIVALAINMPDFYTPERARQAVEQAIVTMIDGYKPKG